MKDFDVVWDEKERLLHREVKRDRDDIYQAGLHAGFWIGLLPGLVIGAAIALTAVMFSL